MTTSIATDATAAGGGADGQAIDLSDLDALIDEQREALAREQRRDGHWCFELEADATIPSEYVFLCHFLGQIDEPLEAKIGNYLRRIQAEHGGWPLFEAGDFDISASVKAYYALKMIGDDPDAPHMARAREAILAHGGAARANVFTRYTLALFGQVPWHAVPVTPVEVVLLPRWFFFHMSKVAYWSRTVMIPLLVIAALKPQARNPKNVHIRELFVTPPEDEKNYIRNPNGTRLGDLFLALDRILRVVEPWFPKRLRKRAIAKSMDFVTERLNGEDGLGGIFPAMANAVMAFDALGYGHDDPHFVTARQSVDKLLVVKEDEAYCQPCLSPVWDTCLAGHAMMEADEPGEGARVEGALDWLLDCEVKDVKGDWSVRRPGLAPGGWAFQYRNDYYPDVDDTAVVVMAMDRAGNPKYRPAIERAEKWILGMQSADGGWGAFEPENTHYHLNSIPFADHGALLDPPTVDVTARCVSMLAQLGYDRDHPAMAKALNYLRREQEDDGSWFGRWGVNYIYGTWSTLCALNAAGEDMNAPYIRKAVDWLKERQRADGGWGEGCETYWEERKDVPTESTASQTAWAVMGLMAAGEVESDAVKRGIAWLQRQRTDGARWDERMYTGGGFPKVFYLKYHGYAAYFPLWAVSRYRNLVRSNTREVKYGM